MYELTYAVYLNEDRSSILQHLANASVVTTRMDGYTETGAGNAGLNLSLIHIFRSETGRRGPHHGHSGGRGHHPVHGLLH